jgi:hypothetical protein
MSGFRYESLHGVSTPSRAACVALSWVYCRGMTALAVRPNPLPTTTSRNREPARVEDFDGFAPPEHTTPLSAIVRRSFCAVEGVATRVEARDWVGGPVLEVTIQDEGHELVLAFFGRRAIAGIETGAYLCAAGVVGRHRRRAIMLNPRYWLAR